MTSSPAILFLDDELEGVKPLVEALTRRGLCIEAVATPTEAFGLLANKPFGVAVSDERMPSTSGIQFLSELAKHYPQVVRVLFTAYTDHNTAVRALNSGNIFRYILKTQPIDEVARILNEALHHFRARAAASRTLMRNRKLDKAEGALSVLRDARYDWGNIVLTQKLQFQKLEALLARAEADYGLDLRELKATCAGAHERVEVSLKEYFRNPFLDSTLTEDEAFVQESVLVPLQLALNKVRAESDADKIAFHLHADPASAPKLWMQRERLKAAIGLILLNAVESISEKGDIRVSITKSGEATEIEIRDTGRGIPTELLTRVFDPLVKTLDKQGHMGIGLTFAKAIVEDHGGTIAIDSKQGEGTRVNIRLPLTKLP